MFTLQVSVPAAVDLVEEDAVETEEDAVETEEGLEEGEEGLEEGEVVEVKRNWYWSVDW